MSNLDVALGYAKRGFPVFPVRANKAPYSRGGFNAATADISKISRWWQRWPDAAVGLPTGIQTKTVVIDVDVKNGRDGLSSLAVLENTFGTFGTQMVSTPSGGWHFYFRYEHDDIRCQTQALGLDGIDVRAEGGYVVAAGSALGDAQYLSSGSAPPAMLPDALADALRGEAVSPRVFGGVPEGQRNDHIFRLASRLCGEGKPLSEATEQCLEVAGRCDPPLNATEVVSTVAGVFGRYGPNGGVLLEQLKLSREQHHREDEVEWVKFEFRETRDYAFLASPAAAGGFFRLMHTFAGKTSRLTQKQVATVTGLSGDDLEELLSMLNSDGELYYSALMDRLFEHAYCSLVVRRLNGKKGGRPTKKPMG